MKKTNLFVSLCAVAVLMTGFGLSHAGPEWPKTITVQTGAAQTSYHTLAIVVADLITKHVEGVSATAVPCSGQSEANSLVIRGDAELLTSSTAGLVGSWNVEKGYIPGGKEHLRTMFNAYMGYFGIFVRADSDIKSIADLRGKKVMCLGSKSAEERFARILEAYGMTYKDIKAAPRLTVGDQIAALKEKTSDCIVRSDRSPTAAFMEMFSSIPVRWVLIDEDKLEALNKKYPSLLDVRVPAGTYPGIDKPVPAAGFAMQIAARTDLPDDLAYEICKAVFTHLDEAKRAAGPIFKQLNTEFAVSTPVIPFHAGAIKYFKEVGTWTSKLDSLNKKMLSEAGQAK